MNAGFDSYVIRPMEQAFVRRASDWVNTVLNRGRLYLSDFLTPREQVLLARMATEAGAVLHLNGGPKSAERKRALLLPDDWGHEPSDFAISVLVTNFNRDANISHGGVLGSILGTGIHRGKLGDIAVLNTQVYAAVCREMVDFLVGEWRFVGRVGIEPTVCSVDDIPVEWPEPLYIRDIIDVTSLRADTVVAHACHLSRARAGEAFAKKEVSINFMEVTATDYPVAEGDIVSLRGFGRIRVFGVVGSTKSDRLRLEVGVLKSSGR